MACTSARGASTKTPTLQTPEGSAAAMAAATSTVTQRGLRAQKLSPIASAPASAANSASAILVTPQIFTLGTMIKSSQPNRARSRTRTKWLGRHLGSIPGGAVTGGGSISFGIGIGFGLANAFTV